MPFPSWSAINRLREIKVLNIGYFGAIAIPIFAQGVNYWNSATEYREAHGFSEVTISWPLFFLYVGSIFLAVATLLAEVCCPRSIKSYRDKREYARAILDESSTDAEISKLAKQSLTRLGEDKFSSKLDKSYSKKNVSELATRIAEAIHTDGNYLHSDSSELRALANYKSRWLVANECRTWLRVITLSFYLSSMAILIILAVVSGCHVIDSLDGYACSGASDFLRKFSWAVSYFQELDVGSQ